jgi:flavin reductase (DIM6/NTAB) family NADH-FMN oxidoreductase RutF
VAVDKAMYRQVVGRFAAGVTVITTGKDGHYHGMTATAFCSLSLDPTLVLICVEKSANTLPVLESAGIFNVNLLAEEQEDLSRLFADKSLQETHGFKGVEHRLGANGAPVLIDCLGYLECRVVQRHDGGDHVIFIGEVEAAEPGSDAAPLLYWRAGYRRLDGGSL